MYVLKFESKLSLRMQSPKSLADWHEQIRYLGRFFSSFLLYFFNGLNCGILIERMYQKSV